MTGIPFPVPACSQDVCGLLGSRVLGQAGGSVLRRMWGFIAIRHLYSL
jgi:hypothetical protein